MMDSIHQHMATAGRDGGGSGHEDGDRVREEQQMHMASNDPRYVAMRQGVGDARKGTYSSTYQSYYGQAPPPLQPPHIPTVQPMYMEPVPHRQPQAQRQRGKGHRYDDEGSVSYDYEEDYLSVNGYELGMKHISTMQDEEAEGSEESSDGLLEEMDTGGFIDADADYNHLDAPSAGGFVASDYSTMREYNHLEYEDEYYDDEDMM